LSYTPHQRHIFLLLPPLLLLQTPITWSLLVNYSSVAAISSSGPARTWPRLAAERKSAGQPPHQSPVSLIGDPRPSRLTPSSPASTHQHYTIISGSIIAVIRGIYRPATVRLNISPANTVPLPFPTGDNTQSSSSSSSFI